MNYHTTAVNIVSLYLDFLHNNDRLETVIVPATVKDMLRECEVDYNIDKEMSHVDQTRLNIHVSAYINELGI
jgi:hypothetical protein